MGEGEAVHLGHRRLLADERREALLLKSALDGADAIRALGMAEGRLMVEASRVSDVKCGHGFFLDKDRCHCRSVIWICLCCCDATPSGAEPCHGVFRFASTTSRSVNPPETTLRLSSAESSELCTMRLFR